MQEEPALCPHCGHEVAKEQIYCPNCGALMNASGQWPPPLPGYAPGPISPPPPSDINSLVSGFITGLAVSLLGSVVLGAGLIVAGVLYFVFRQKQPTFARGWGFGFLACIVILLGLFVICTWSLMGSWPYPA